MQSLKTHHILVQGEKFRGRAQRSWAPSHPGGQQQPRKAPGKMDLNQNSNPEVLTSAVAIETCTSSMYGAWPWDCPRMGSSHPFTTAVQEDEKASATRIHSALAGSLQRWHWRVIVHRHFSQTMLQLSNVPFF